MVAWLFHANYCIKTRLILLVNIILSFEPSYSPFKLVSENLL